ncbi:MAG: hypothetical protein ACSHYB_00320 [Roseibacillus sp.]
MSSIHAQTAKEWVAYAEKLEVAGDTPKALASFLEADKKKPNDASILVKIGKQWGDYMAELKGGQRQDAAQKSLSYSKQALKVAPKNSDSHLAVALSLGKNVEFMGNKQKIQASKDIKFHAERALALNPKSDYAHHLLGRWHQNVSEMGGVTRTIAKVIYGEIPQGSLTAALGHFQKARQLRADRLVHQIEYGRTLVMMGEKGKGVAEIKKGLAMPNKDKDDPESKVRGRAMLK